MNKPLKYGLFLVLSITVINFIIILLFGFISKNNLFLFLAALLSAIIISIIVIFTTPVLKDFLATYRTLMRLENLSHPLLLRLSMEAPGTYHHSIMVANLAYKAAKSINADSLLTRVGGYYHDIGKLANPDFFIENQSQNQNPHDEISNPRKSAKIIIDHTAEGLKLAKEYNLPKEVMAFIPEHQGTSLISFFYEQAKEKGIKVKKNEFHYPGPKPLSRETAILMLADAIEAKLRLCPKVTTQIIEETVDEIIKNRMEEKQLELSGLTSNELDRIHNSFIETLKIIFHQRIDYPEKNATNL